MLPRGVLGLEGAVRISPNLFAYIAFWLAPLVVLGSFFVMRPQRAVLFAMVVGMATLPERLGFIPPAFTPILKTEFMSLAALAGILIKHPQLIRKAPPFRDIELTMVGLLLCSVGSTFTNMDTIVAGVSVFPGMAVTDVAHIFASDLVELWLPFYIGRVVFRTREDIKELVVFVAVVGLVYTPFCVYEMKMGPETHKFFYGYFQHEWVQALRSGGGFRPMVCMAHGLAVAMFMLAASNFAIVATKFGKKVLYWKSRYVGFFIWFVFLLAKSAGASIYSFVSVPAVLFTKPRMQMRLAKVLALTLLLYPALKLSDLFPADQIVELSAKYGDPARANSLAARMGNDRLLMDKARKRLSFGWGLNARNRVVDAAGQDIAVPDGWWVINIGQRGMPALVLMFAFMLWPLRRISRAVAKLKDGEDAAFLAVVGLTSVFGVMDLLPNSLFNPLPLFYLGAATGVAEVVLASREPSRAPAGARARAPVAGRPIASPAASRAG